MYYILAPNSTLNLSTTSSINYGCIQLPDISVLYVKLTRGNARKLVYKKLRRKK